jgi:hypothetical protein
MSYQIITPNYVIELNQDYTISNHGIHKHVCSYYRKYVFNSKEHNIHIQQGGTVFAENSRKYFTSSALRYLEKYKLTPSDILSEISDSYNPEHYNSTRIDDMNDYLLQMGGRINTPNITNDIVFKEDYSGDKADKRLVYLISVSNKPIVVKISQAKEQYKTEKRIYRYFNKRANKYKDGNKKSKSPKYDPIVDTYVLRTYETQYYPNEYLDRYIPYILLPCNLDGKNIKIKLSNEIVPISDGIPFISNNDGIIGSYDSLKMKYDKCLYVVMETRPTYFIFKDYVKGEANPSILKRLFYKTANLLKYLNQMYSFNHWDLHYHNLMVYVSPKHTNGGAILDKNIEVDVCFFDFDLSAVGNNTDTNIDAYSDRLDKYITPNHNLFNSYKRMLKVPDTQKEPNVSPYIKDIFKILETFLNKPLYTSYNLQDNMEDNVNKLEKYFKYMGRIHDIIRLVNINKPGLDITENDVHKNKNISNHTDESNTNIELIIIYNLMNYMSLNSHKHMAYATLIYTDFFLYLRNDKVFRKTILKL